MDDLKVAIMSLILALLVGWFCGWVHAHNAIANECERLGGFFVGEKVFECVNAKGLKDKSQEAKREKSEP